ncbi:hypothetical protein ADL21_00870 [Streptomyces albus subsp. albus]|nr:hypothetical protein ADL21_00870 [Streptomyces albus subsp. albus]
MRAKPRAASRTESRIARLLTDGLEPKNWILLLTLLIGWHAGRWTGIGWGLFAGLFSGIVPLLFIKFGERRGYWGDRHVRRRQDRLVVIPFIMASVALGMSTMMIFHAPGEMIAVVAAMLATLIVILAITTKWKVSVHGAVSSGAIAVLALAYGQALLVLYPLVAAVGWSRISLKDHTPAQVLVGSVLGPLVAGGTYWALC